MPREALVRAHGFDDSVKKEERALRVPYVPSELNPPAVFVCEGPREENEAQTGAGGATRY
jgi:hypothetical protein